MSYREFSETAAILDAILNFSKRSRVHRVHPADSKNVDSVLPKSMIKIPAERFLAVAKGMV